MESLAHGTTSGAPTGALLVWIGGLSMARAQNNATVLRHLKALSHRMEQSDFSSLAEDAALRIAIVVIDCIEDAWETAAVQAREVLK